jgi:hypothetical protein
MSSHPANNDGALYLECRLTERQWEELCTAVIGHMEELEHEVDRGAPVSKQLMVTRKLIALLQQGVSR